MKFCFRGTMNNMSEHLLLDNITVTPDDGGVGISAIDKGPWTIDHAAYDLQGHAVSRQAKKGVYVSSGRKVVVK